LSDFEKEIKMLQVKYIFEVLCHCFVLEACAETMKKGPCARGIVDLLYLRSLRTGFSLKEVC
jgi:hypothetical protein